MVKELNGTSQDGNSKFSYVFGRGNTKRMYGESFFTFFHLVFGRAYQKSGYTVLCCYVYARMQMND